MFWKKKQPTQDIGSPMLIAFRMENADSTLAVHLEPDQLGSPGEVGVMLADIARQMARALVQSGYDGTKAQAFNQIINILNAEANAPTQP